MNAAYNFDEAARLPLPGDNVAIATRRLEAGTTIYFEGKTLTLDFTVLEGHRFAVKTISTNEALLSWELPFGLASKHIDPGNYVINQGTLDALNMRSLDFPLPKSPNFKDYSLPINLDETSFQPSPALPGYPDTRTFMGYRRSGGRGVGTRNTIVLLGTTSLTGSYVTQLAASLQEELGNYPQFDGIVPVAHTEGGVDQPNNLELLLRTLAGFVVHPNVGAVLIVDYGNESVTNKMLEAYMRKHQYPLENVLHQFMSVKGSFTHNLNLGKAVVRDWLPLVNAMERTPESISHLKLALQCGGSDAFSGVSANPLLGWISRELVQYGGAANLGETDELIGAESYVLQKVKDLETARKFLDFVEQFKERASWHGASAEGNPSGGNKYRGLYNIYLKSIGAARKKAPETRLDYCIGYAEPMKDSGFHFMDSPGNDLEGIAGQVAAGCNMIMFTTGNGSVTNFPFVPTLKVVTTTQRYQLLSNDMDINAGQYQEGLSMDELGRQSFELLIETASGKLSVGEKAGHSQVQIWRNWRQTDASQLDTLLNAPRPKGEPIPIQTGGATSPIHFTQDHAGIGLILPTSLCSSQVAKKMAKRLNERFGKYGQISNFVALPHTEGCGNNTGPSEQLFARTMISYTVHPLVKHCLLLEHGCEKTHNDFMRRQMEDLGVDPGRFGYASIQLNGGIEKATEKVEAWFADQVSKTGPAAKETVGLESLRIGILTDGSVTDEASGQLVLLIKMIVGAGGTVVIPENSELISTPAFKDLLITVSDVGPSLAYGEHAKKTGFHIMETPTEHLVETTTGLAATGVELLIAMVNDHPMQTHPFVPMLQMATDQMVQQSYASDLDLLLSGNPEDWTGQILKLCKQVVEHNYTPKLFEQGNVDFQITRGLLGVTL